MAWEAAKAGDDSNEVVVLLRRIGNDLVELDFLNDSTIADVLSWYVGNGKK